MVSNRMIVTFLLITIVALAGAGCSDDNPVTPGTPIDTAPPAVPANLSVDYNAETAVVNWDLSTVDTDLAGYIVIREHNGVSEILVRTPALISSYEDPNPPSGVSLYHVYAVDTSGNQSAMASVSLTTSTGRGKAEVVTSGSN